VSKLSAAPAPTRLLVILVSFADVGITTSTAAWANVFFGADGKTVNTYFKQASKNHFYFLPAQETQGTIGDGVIRVTLDSDHPNEGGNTGSGTRTAVRDALMAADPDIDFGLYDANGDGYLSMDELHIVLVFAGYENAYSSAYTPLLWAHHWRLSYPVSAPCLDDVWVAASSSGGYIAVGEYHASATSVKHAATIGVICHELGHDLGLPDLYDTDFSSDGVGTHCLMGCGNWGRAATGDSYLGQTPVLPSAYCRQFLGFSNVRVGSGENTVYALTQVSDDTNSTDIVRLDTPNAHEYFLVENRQLTGFDAGLYYYTGSPSGGGLAVWHIDTSVAANTDDARRLVDFEEAADPCLDVYGTPLGRVANYYYDGNAIRFDETTFPSNTLNGGGASLTRVCNVSASGTTMTFTGDAGASLTSLAAVVDVEWTRPFETGTPAWTWQTAITHDGIDAAQSGWVYSLNRISYMSTVVTGPVQVVFWWRNGSVTNSETLRFVVDGQPRASITGDTATAGTWFRYADTLRAGVHTNRWEFYTTRNTGTSNAGYVDQLSLTPLVSVLAMDASPLSFNWTGGLRPLAIYNTGNTSLFWQATAPSWCPASPDSGALSAGATQWVSVACSTNWASAFSRVGTLAVTATNVLGTAVVGSPAAATITQTARQTYRGVGTVFIAQ